MNQQPRGRLHQDPTFVFSEFDGLKIQQLVISQNRKTKEPIIVFIKVAGKNWHQYFLDAGIGFWEDWGITTLEDEEDDTYECLEVTEKYDLRDKTILSIECLKDQKNSKIVINLADSSQLILRCRDAQILDSTCELVKQKHILIQPYQPSWKQNFQQLQSILLTAIAHSAIIVEHVGSTSVKDLPAKAIIDIDLVYPKTVDFAYVKSKLEEIGYYHNGDQGIYEREAFKRKVTYAPHAILDDIPHHLYVCLAHSAELKRHLLFRDYLRIHAEARAEYAELKYQIAELTNQDRKAYALLKESMAKSFIEGIIKKASAEIRKS